MVIKRNILVTGSNGQLGSSLKEISINYNFNFFFKEKKELDITYFDSLENFLKKNNIQTIINCAAYTNVNKAEKNKILSNKVNNTGVENIAKLCNYLNIQLIHISTDYVFDGFNKNIPYRELNNTNPQNYYGKTKLNGEKKILNYDLKNSAIIRTSWLYSKFDKNFVSQIIKKLKNEKEIFVVDDEIGSPTYALDLSKVIMEIIPRLSNIKTEIFHFSNLGFCSRFRFAIKIKEIINSDCIVQPKTLKFTKTKRPNFSALDSTKIIKKFQLSVRPWEKSLEYHLKN